MKNRKAAGILLIIITLIISLIIMLLLLMGKIMNTNEFFDIKKENKSTEIIKPDEFKPLSARGKNLYKFEDGLYKGYYDENLNVKIKPKFEVASEFTDGVAIVSKGDKYGVIDNKGNIIVKPKYSELTRYTEGITIGQKFLSRDIPIDRNGNRLDKDILENQYQNGIFIYKDKILDYYNNELQDINNKYNCIHMIYDKIIVSNKEYTKFGVIDTAGNQLLKIKYDEIYSYSNFGYFFVSYNGEKCIINLKGEKIMSLKEDVMDAYFESDDLIRVIYSDDSNEIINKDGKILINKNDGSKYGIYGDFIIKEEELDSYNEDEVINDKKIEVYNKKMKLIYSDKVNYYNYNNSYYYEDDLNFKERVLEIKSQNANEYYLDTDGKLVNKIIYEK